MKIITIGRATTNNVVLQDNQVSGTHAQIIIKPNNCYSIVDLNSTNGTYVNNIRINGETILNANDVVKIGNSVIPWQEYVNVSNKQAGVAAPIPSYLNSHNAPRHSEKRQKSGGILGYVVCSVVTAILVGGIMGFLMYSTTKSKQQEIDALDKQIAELNEEKAEIEIRATNDNSELLSEQLDLQEDLEKQIEALKQTTGKLTDANKNNKELNEQIEKFHKTVEGLQSNLAEVSQNLKETESALSKKEGELKAEQDKLKEKEQELADKQAELEATQKELDKARAQLNTSKSDYTALETENLQLRNTLKNCQEITIPELNWKVRDLEAENERLKKRLSKATAQTGEANNPSETETPEPVAD